jgi:hypothetical protein
MRRHSLSPFIVLLCLLFVATPFSRGDDSYDVLIVLNASRKQLAFDDPVEVSMTIVNLSARNIMLKALKTRTRAGQTDWGTIQWGLFYSKDTRIVSTRFLGEIKIPPGAQIRRTEQFYLSRKDYSFPAGWYFVDAVVHSPYRLRIKVCSDALQFSPKFKPSRKVREQ